MLFGALSMLFGCELVAPHGGLFVLFIPNAISHVMMYILAIAAGSLVTGVAGEDLRHDLSSVARSRPSWRPPDEDIMGVTA